MVLDLFDSASEIHNLKGTQQNEKANKNTRFIARPVTDFCAVNAVTLYLQTAGIDS